MKILICVSHDEQLEKAKLSLSDHEVTVVTSAHHALGLITSTQEKGVKKRGEWDAVLTAFSIHDHTGDTKLCPLGPLVALEAITQDRPLVAILSPDHTGEKEGCETFFKLGIWNSVYPLHNSLIFMGGNLKGYQWRDVLEHMLEHQKARREEPQA